MHSAVVSDSDAASDKKIFEALEDFYYKLVGKMKRVPRSAERMRRVRRDIT